MNGTMTRVFVADDNELILKMLDRLLSLDFEVVGQAVDGEAAVEAVLDTEPDVVVLDYMMPRQDGIEAARSILAQRPDQQIILYTAFLDGDIEHRAQDAGIEAARSILAQRPDQQIILYTAFLDGDIEHRAQDAGIFQCVTKVDGPLALERVIRRLAGELF